MTIEQAIASAWGLRLCVVPSCLASLCCAWGLRLQSSCQPLAWQTPLVVRISRCSKGSPLGATRIGSYRGRRHPNVARRAKPIRSALHLLLVMAAAASACSKQTSTTYMTNQRTTAVSYAVPRRPRRHRCHHRRHHRRRHRLQDLRRGSLSWRALIPSSGPSTQTS